MSAPYRVLILGGYGTFGGRLIRLLGDTSDLTLICAGRSLQKARAFAAENTDLTCQIIPLAADRNGDLTDLLREQSADLIVDASGPFQVYGARPYRVVEAALAAGISYIDLADGADFVEGIAQFDAQARERGVSVLSGASTFPTLSAAVVRALSQGWQRVDSIVSGLAPSPKAGLGRNVIGAIMSYAGKPVPVIADGQTRTAPALINSRRLTIAPPGIEPLPPLRFSLIDLPDQRLFPALWPEMRALWPGVGTRPQFLLRVLNMMARLVQWRVLPSLSAFAAPAFWTMKRMPWGSHRGGLIIEVEGLDESGDPASRAWHMIAEGDDGPDIPAMAAAALVRRHAAGNPPAPGARPPFEDVDLDTYRSAFAAKTITDGFREAPPPGAPLYQRMLGRAWDGLPAPIREMHRAPDGLTVSGTATVDRGRSPLSRLVGAVVGFPKAGSGIPVSVTFSHEDGGELWQRRFAGKPFSSLQKEGSGSFTHLLSERFGPLEFGLALVLKDDRLWLITKSWRAFGIPMPRFLAPGGDAFEHVDVEGRFCFHVEIRHWLTGLIVRYQGHLTRPEHPE